MVVNGVLPSVALPKDAVKLCLISLSDSHSTCTHTHTAGHEAVLIGLASYLKDLQWFMQLLLHGMQTLPSEMSPKIPGDNSQNNSAGVK